jgi:hypothetical protein
MCQPKQTLTRSARTVSHLSSLPNLYNMSSRLRRPHADTIQILQARSVCYKLHQNINLVLVNEPTFCVTEVVADK